MSIIDWISLEKFPEYGVDRGVLYLETVPGVAWNGLVSLDETESDSSESFTYYDGDRKTILQNDGSYLATLSSYMYPKELTELEGYFTSQRKRQFGLSYRTQHGSAYKIHLVYNAAASPTNVRRESQAEAMTPSKMSWIISTFPTTIPWAKPAAHLVVDATTARYPEAIEALENILYGTDSSDPRLPSPEEVIELFESYVIFRVTYNGDGTLTIEGPDDMIYSLNEDELEVTSPSLLYFDENTMSISSY